MIPQSQPVMQTPPAEPLARSAFRYRLPGWLMLALGLIFSTGAAAAISASSDRDPVAIDEPFNLMFSADATPDGDPDFSPLNDDFEILQQGQSTRVTMINGQLSRVSIWKVTVTARQLGSVSVPSIAFGRDRSNAFALTVTPGQAATGGNNRPSDELMLEAEAEPRNPYVQAQVLLTLRILHRVALSGGQLEDPKLSDAMVQKLGEDRRYQTERHGQPYGVIERRFAIFPQKSGPLQIEPITLEAEASAGPGSMFDQFFGARGRIKRVRSAPITLQVRAIPQAFKGRPWLPAAKLQLDEAWSSDPPETKVGEPLTRTLSIRADGVTMGMLPELSTKALNEIGGLQQYPDQPALKEDFGQQGLNSSRREKTAFIPARGGSFRLPALEIAWWNTTTDKAEVARLPERLLRVKPAAAPAAPPEEALGPAAEKAEIPTVAADAPGALAVEPRGASSELWFWLTWMLAAAWAATALAWWLSSARRARAPQRVSDAATDHGGAMKALERACSGSDPTAARAALIAWGRMHWPADPPTNLEQLAARLDAPLPAQIAALNRALYGRSGGEWPGPAIYQAVAAASKQRAGRPSTGASGDPLVLLHRL